MKKGVQVNFNLSNRWLYTLITILVVSIIGVGVYAISHPNPGHSSGEIEEADPTVNAYIKNKGSCAAITGSADLCDGIDNEGVIVESDPTVKSWAQTNSPAIPGDLRVGNIGTRSRIYLTATSGTSKGGYLYVVTHGGYNSNACGTWGEGGNPVTIASAGSWYATLCFKAHQF